MAEKLPLDPKQPNPGAERSMPPLPELIKVVDHSPALEQRARQAGSALGKAVAALRNMQEKLRERRGESAGDKIRVIAGRGRARAQEIGETAASRAQEWGEIARERSQELKRRAQAQWDRAQAKARSTAQEKPVQVALGAAAAGFLLGMALRIRRARHA